MNINENLIKETIKFSIIMIFFSFIVSYLTDFISGKKIIWIPDHSNDMISGIFYTSSLVYILFSEKYIKYKCMNNKK